MSRVPQERLGAAILKSNLSFLFAMQIIVTQPRKIAAQELAGRVAFEYAAGNPHHAKQAGVVGFHVGGHRAFNEHTCRIKYMTEAVLLNEMLNGADLGRCSSLPDRVREM